MDVPDDVEITREARKPEWDPTVGIEVRPVWQGQPQHRLVTIGDSITQGFASGAVYQTNLSYSAIIAYELGWAGLRYPRYGGPGGLPLNLELLMRELEAHFGAELSLLELPFALFRGRRFMDDVEDYWERGAGSQPPPASATNHVLAVYGWDLRDALVRTYDSSLAEIGVPSDDLVQQIVQNHGARAALRVLPRTTAADRGSTVFDAAAALGADPGDDPDHGIETLVVFLGANNALGAVTQLKVVWSDTGYDDLASKDSFTVWRPSHFIAELQRVVAKIQEVRARHVIWCTVPHVTIAPIARGVAGKVAPNSRYFAYYTRPWISDTDFDVGRDPSITADEARAVDSAIDQYNDAITAVVANARGAGRDWYLLDVAGVLDRLASRRYLDSPQARPPWWQPYPLPPELATLNPVPDSRFLTSDGTGRRSGGLFSLDGVHPTTVGYGIIAQELINVMASAGVTFNQPDGQTPRLGPSRVDFTRLIRLDTLLTHPPTNVADGLRVLGWADEALDLMRRVIPF